jgi:hypothetical protein
MYRGTGLVSALLYVLVALWMVSPAQAQCSRSNCQIILSGTGLSATPNPPCTPWGFWLWSQPNTNNAYGNDGDGSIYFYAIAPAEAHADVSNVTLSRNSAGQSVVSESASGTFPNGTTVDCTLTAHQTSPGRGVLDSMECTLVTKSGTDSCAVTDIPITVDISNASK